MQIAFKSIPKVFKFCHLIKQATDAILFDKKASLRVIFISYNKVRNPSFSEFHTEENRSQAVRISNLLSHPTTLASHFHRKPKFNLHAFDTANLARERYIFAVTLKCCYTAQFSQQLVSQQELSRNVFQCATLSTALHEVESKFTFAKALQQLVASLHSVSPLQQLCSQFFSHVLYKRMRKFIICSETIWIRGVFSLPRSKILKVAENDCTVEQGQATCFRNGVERDKSQRKLRNVTAPLVR